MGGAGQRMESPWRYADSDPPRWRPRQIPRGDVGLMGRPRVYEGAGAPILQVRLTPALLEQVRARGGSAWVRGLIEEACTAQVAASDPCGEFQASTTPPPPKPIITLLVRLPCP